MATPVCVVVAQDTAPQQAEGGNRSRMGRGVNGEVVSVSCSSITIKNERGETWNVITTDNTRMMKNRQPVKTADIKAGDGVMAMGVPDVDKLTYRDMQERREIIKQRLEEKRRRA